MNFYKKLMDKFFISCVIAGLLASGASSSQERELYNQSWNQLQKATHVGGNFYPPPWIQRRIRRGGMVYLLIRRLLTPTEKKNETNFL